MSETYATYKVWDGCRAPVNLEYNGRLMGQIVREFTIDRDALLDLATDMETWAEMQRCTGSIDDPAANRIGHFADRIREACGEVSR